MKSLVKGGPFGFVFDRGCFHSFDSDQDRSNFAEKAASHLEKNGFWLSLIGNADEVRDGHGPPRCTAKDIVIAVEPYFEILSLATGFFEAKQSTPPRAWICFMQKRTIIKG